MLASACKCLQGAGRARGERAHAGRAWSGRARVEELVVEELVLEELVLEELVLHSALLCFLFSFSSVNEHLGLKRMRSAKVRKKSKLKIGERPVLSLTVKSAMRSAKVRKKSKIKIGERPVLFLMVKMTRRHCVRSTSSRRPGRRRTLGQST